MIQKIKLMALFLLAAGPVWAVSYTNTASGNWSDPTKWSTAAGLSGQDTVIVFKPLATDNSTNDNTGAFTLNQMVVASQIVNLYASGGSSLLFASDTGGNLPVITNAGTSAFTINVPLTLANNLIIGGAAANGAITINSNITESTPSALIKTGANTLTLNPGNSYSGTTSIKAGTLTLTGTGIVDAAGSGTIIIGDSSGASPATLNFSANSGTSGTHSNNITVNAGATGTLSINNPGNITYIIFSGTVALNNNLTTYKGNGLSLIFNALVTQDATAHAITNTARGATFAGGIQVGSGGLTLVEGIGASGDYRTLLTVSGGVIGTGNLTLQNDSTLANGITLSGAGINNIGAVINAGAGTNSVLISSVIGTNVTSVTQNSTFSTLILSGANSYTGATTVNNGMLTVSNVVSMPITTALRVQDNALVNLNGHTQSVASVGGAGQVSNGWLKVTSALYPGGGSAVGTLTLTNLTLSENSTIYWDYGAGGTDTNRVLGVANLPTNATVVVSGSGTTPSAGVLFLSGTNVAPGGVTGWTVTGAVQGKVIQNGNRVELVTQSRGMWLSVY